MRVSPGRLVREAPENHLVPHLTVRKAGRLVTLGFDRRPVNLSVRQVLAPDIVDVVHDILQRTGVPPKSVCLELTESVFMGDVEYFSRTLANLKGLGVNLSTDDFGTGYSSLSYLKQFPVDEVKSGSILCR
jgi:EAL domain-containing protein (putative c-di-GMP-specific phosphodiesterase class I)